MGKEKNKISMPVVRRLPKYYRALTMLENEGATKTSSKQLSQLMNITASQVRQDLNTFGGFGQLGYGYLVESLKSEIESILGINIHKPAIIYGVGNLGRALFCHFDFEKSGFKLMGVFDKNPELVGQKLGEFTVMDDSELEAFCENHMISSAVICMPSKSVGDVIDRLYAVGIRGYWNFSHYDISGKYPDCVVENVHLSESLLALSFLLGESDSAIDNREGNPIEPEDKADISVTD